MSRKLNWKLGVTLGLVVCFMVASGGLVMGSNLGFKLNKPIIGSFFTDSARDNWTSLPYNSPYTTAESLCVALGLSSGGGLVSQLNLTAGGASFSNHSCNIPPSGGDFALQFNKGVLIRSIAAAPTSGIIVGSSNEATALPEIFGGFINGPIGDNRISVPYHSTWVSPADVCTSLGLNAGGGQIIRNDAFGTGAGGASRSCQCPCIGGFTSGTPNLVLGESILVRKSAGGSIIGFLPPHF